MSPISRRHFLEGSVAAVGLAALPLRRARAASASPDIVEVDGTDPKKMVAAAVEALGGIKAFVKKGAHHRAAGRPGAGSSAGVRGGAIGA